MKANELRIGNIFSDKEGNTLTCLGATAQGHEHESIVWYDQELGFYIPIEECQHIPLTEEWLIKLGFEKINSSEYISYYKIEIKDENDYENNLEVWLSNGYSTSWHLFNKDNEECLFSNKLEYVHQLQNLYFSLTGEELELIP